jgi:nicotinamidase-related amidase
MKIDLLIIDPQNDFCDPEGSLFVAGANEDMDRVSEFIDRQGNRIDDIHVTLDSHYEDDIAHPVFWEDSNGHCPPPFTIITPEDFCKKWYPAKDGNHDKVRNYLSKLRENGKYDLCIWPPHCIVGTDGRGVYRPVFESIANWEYANVKKAHYVTKGLNRGTENYSAIRADVIDPEDPATDVNWEFLSRLYKADVVYVGGEALSHCVISTLLDIARYWGNDASKITLLTDCCSNVDGCDALGENGINELSLMGMKTTKSTEIVV